MTTIDDLDTVVAGMLEPSASDALAVPSIDVAALLAASVSANTARNYRQGWTRFTTWCTQHGHVALPVVPASELPTVPAEFLRSERIEQLTWAASS